MKKLKSVKDTHEEQLKMLTDQAEKQPIISNIKNPNFNNVSFCNSLHAKSMKVFNEINELDENISYSNLNFIGLSKKYTFNFKHFMSLGSLLQNIYNDNVSLDAAKQEQRKMEEKLKDFIEYNPVKDNYKNQKLKILPNGQYFYKVRREILIAFEESIFLLPKPYVFGEREWKEKDLRKKRFMTKDFLEKSFLERLGYTPLSEKENKLLDKNFKLKNIDKLKKDDLEKVATGEEYDKLFNFINKRVNVLKKLVKTVADNVEKKKSIM